MRGLNGLRGLQYADGSDIINILSCFMFIIIWCFVCLLIYKFLKLFLKEKVAENLAYGLCLSGAFLIFVYYVPFALIAFISLIVGCLIAGGLMVFLKKILKLKLKEKTEENLGGGIVLVTATLAIPLLMYILDKIGWLPYLGLESLF